MKLKKIYWLPIFIFIFNISKSQKQEHNLNSNWIFYEKGSSEKLKAKVPGTIHTDLLNHNKIPNPFYRDNENKIQWIENKDWVYETIFDVDDHIINKDKIVLSFESIDTYADVYLNEKPILKTDNMFLSYDVDIKNLVLKQQNKLKIVFYSPVKMGLEKAKKFSYLLPATNEQATLESRTNIHSRKAPFHYGWDWGPRFVTSGISGDIKLMAWNDIDIKDMRVQQITQAQKNAKFSIQNELEIVKSEEYSIKIFVNNSLYSEEKKLFSTGKTVLTNEINISNPKLWWPNGYGEQNLYEIKTSIFKGEKELSSISKKIGIRTIELIQSPDSVGYSFYFKVNGYPIFAKGTNYIPGNIFTPIVSNQYLDSLFDIIKSSNMNMIRVWGGGIYERDYFYELCDKHGILVWQDFMFACSMQPGNDEHMQNIKSEAIHQVKRLRDHPSLALWCGNNENLMSMYGWEWSKKYKMNSIDSIQMWENYNKLYNEMLPTIVNKYSNLTPYWPSSPQNREYNRFADRNSGDTHDWVIWFAQEPFRTYRWTHGRFTSEYGMQSFPEMKTIKTFSTEKDWKFDSPIMHHRQRSKMDNIKPGFDGNDMIMKYIGYYYNVPKKFEDIVYVSQLMQAEGLKAGIEAHRMKKPFNMGSLYWQINDCWQTISWATVDFYLRWKAAQYQVKKSFKPVISAKYVEKDTVEIFICSDIIGNQDFNIKLSCIDFSGNVIKSFNFSENVNYEASKLVFKKAINEILGTKNRNEHLLLIEIFKNDTLIDSDQLYFSPIKDLVFSNSKVKFDLIKTDSGYNISLESSNLVKNLYLDLKESKEGFFTDNYFDLIPNKKYQISLKTKQVINKQDIILKYLNTLN